MNTNKLNQFTNPSVLKQIGNPRLVRFFSPFGASLQAADITWPQYRPGDDEFFVTLAQLLALPRFPAEPRQALARIERLAAPQNADSLNSAFISHLQDMSIPTTSPTLDKALELWFCSPRLILELTDPLMPSETPIGDAIKIQAAPKIENPECEPNKVSTSALDSCNSCELALATPKSNETKLVAPNSGEQPAAASTPIQNPKSKFENVAAALPAPPAVSPTPSHADFVPQGGIRGSEIEIPKSKFENHSDSVAFSRLAALTPAQYDRVRKQEAAQLGIRADTLDAEVGRVRAELQQDAAFQAALATLRSIDPWPEPVDAEHGLSPAELLSQVASRFTLQAALPPGAADALTLWSAHTHIFQAFAQTPRLNLSSPERGCGKTTVLDIVASLVPRPLRTENLTAPVLFRLVDQYHPTLLLDEVDAWLHQAEELRGLLNAGHKRGACAYRCDGDGNAVRPFKAFAPAALAGIGPLPGTLHDRSIVIPLLPAMPGEVAARFDETKAETEHLLARKLARWTADNLSLIRDLASRIFSPNSDQSIPGHGSSCSDQAINYQLPTLNLHNRVGDNWRPLFAIAHAAGGDWPDRVLTAFIHHTSALNAQDQPSTNIHLLSDIRRVFASLGVERLPSRHLLQALCDLPDAPWLEVQNHKPLTETALSRRLRPFGITPRIFRINGTDKRIRGYELTDLKDAFARFLPPPP